MPENPKGSSGGSSRRLVGPKAEAQRARRFEEHRSTSCTCHVLEGGRRSASTSQLLVTGSSCFEGVEEGENGSELEAGSTSLLTQRNG